MEDEVLEKKTEMRPDAISLLFNSTRQRILQHLCAHPCDNLTQISRKINISLPTAKFHLDKLGDNGYVISKQLGKKQVFYLVDMVSDDIVEILAVLNEEMVNKIYKKIQEMPGISQKELCETWDISHQGISRYLKKMLDLELIREMKTGRYVRYFTTDLLTRLEKENKARLRGFKKIILHTLKKEGLKPDLIRSTEKELVVTIKLGREVSTLKLHARPFTSIFID
ncbi:MAG: winged helix-turn-helix transcriptional regulator [Thermoplasmata archaeon]|nr:MAG: winged helix-turn-helix transcriptional regulator [Thermoplasmata archaeon]